jgi:hypothetical protein
MTIFSRLGNLEGSPKVPENHCNIDENKDFNMINRRTLLNNLIRTILLVVFFMPILLNPGVSGKAAPSGTHDSNLLSEVVPDSQLENKVFLPYLSNSHPWLNHPFGVESEMDITSSVLAEPLTSLHVGWMRINHRISWRVLQPNRGDPIQWDLLKDFEEELFMLRQNGIKPVVIVDDYPRWATIVENSCSPLREDRFDDFAQFARALVRRYSTPVYNVYDWEMGNEVDVDPRWVPVDSQYGCWGDIKDEFYGGYYYGEMLKVVGKAMKEENPEARVWVGGLMAHPPDATNPRNGEPDKFLYGILEAGAAPYFDVVPFHGHLGYYNVYMDSDTDLSGPWIEWGGGIRGKTQYLTQVMASYGVTKTLFLNELGVGCPDKYDFCNPPPEEFYQYQAEMGVRAAIRTVSEGVEGFIWYILHEGWREMGLLNLSFEPKPVFYAYQELIEQLYWTNYVSPVDYGEFIEAYEFQKDVTQYDRSIIHVLWAKKNNKYNVRIPQDRFVEARTIDGQLITPMVDGDQYKIVVGFSPIYVHLRP